MSKLPLPQAIQRIQENDERMDRFANGGDTETFTTSGGVVVPSFAKFVKDHDAQLTAFPTALAGSGGGAMVGNAPSGGISATTVQSAINELDAEKASLLQLASSAGSSLIGFLQSGVGAIIRAIQDKLRERISPEDFGAVGDGITNDKSAIDKAATAASGKSLYFTPGKNYRCDGGFDISGDNTHVIGYGATLTYNSTATFNHCIRIFGNNCSVRGIKVKSPGGLVRDDTGFGISVGQVATQTTNVTVADCILEDVASAGIWFSNVRMAKALNNVVTGCKADGIHFSDGCFNPIACGNELYNNGDDAIAVINDTAGAPLVGNAMIEGNIIEGGTFVGAAAGHGIALIGVAGANVSGNHIINTIEPGIGTYHWIDSGNPADGLHISGNTLVNTGAGGTAFGGCGINLQETAKAIITGNTIRNLQYNGTKINGAIRCTSSTELVIHGGNNMYDNACEDIIVTNATTKLIISGNTFGFSSRTPVLVSGTVGHCTVANNSFNDNAATNDIDVNLPSAPVYVYGNRCSKAVAVVSNLASNYGIAREELETFTSTITAQTGTITTAAGTIAYQRRGRFMFVEAVITITTNGTGASAVLATLPFVVASGVLNGRENGVSGKQLTALAAGTNQITIRNYDNTYPGANGASMTISGILRIA